MKSLRGGRSSNLLPNYYPFRGDLKIFKICPFNRIWLPYRFESISLFADQKSDIDPVGEALIIIKGQPLVPNQIPATFVDVSQL